MRVRRLKTLAADLGAAEESAPTMQVTLHDPTTIFTLRHSPSWVLLSMSAGAVNAGGFLACRRFVSHVTGTATMISINAHLQTLAVDLGLLMGSFILGAATSVLALQGRTHKGQEPWHHVPLIAVSAILALAAALGMAGVFGAFGGRVQSTADLLLLAMLSFSMGLQNASVATLTGFMVRTTHLTGPASDLGVYLGTAAVSVGAHRGLALRAAGLRALKIVAFIGGASIMVPMASALGFGAFLFPAVTVLVATALSFVPAWWSSLEGAQREPSEA